ncbi:hypothetical protein ACFFIX_13130 [Metabacillus herbersteinensis]|uniref:Uncharacterized protein n=1 Tax=Metabacillus herbersteinensis TaxID=283816 RepID=A0ABV6GFB1_9BACI
MKGSLVTKLFLLKLMCSVYLSLILLSLLSYPTSAYMSDIETKSVLLTIGKWEKGSNTAIQGTEIFEHDVSKSNKEHSEIVEEKRSESEQHAYSDRELNAFREVKKLLNNEIPFSDAINDVALMFSKSELQELIRVEVKCAIEEEREAFFNLIEARFAR